MDLLILGRAGYTPGLLLYGVTVSDTEIRAQGYSVLYDLKPRVLRALEHTDPESRQWRVQRGGLKAKVPRLEHGHHIQTPITLQRR